MPNLPVLTVEGLVGRVAECGAWTSRVVLVGDPNCPVAASLTEGGETGIIRGASDGDLRGKLVDLSYLSRDALVKAGQRVITSGQGGVFPRGIAIGEVVDAQPVDDGIYLDARVRLAVDLGTLDRVWVKLP
jgi:rod shape-determining protein MreC